MSDINTIIERINNLMAIAENEASSDNEAQMAFERAQKLINEYRIEDWKRDRTRTNKPIIERGVNVSKTTIYHQQGYLATIRRVLWGYGDKWYLDSDCEYEF